MIDCTELRKLAEQAGTWTSVPMYSIGSPHQWLPEKVDAFCCAANPTTILALLDEIERLKDEIEAARRVFDRIMDEHNELKERLKTAVADAINPPYNVRLEQERDAALRVVEAAKEWAKSFEKDFVFCDKAGRQAMRMVLDAILAGKGPPL